MIRFCDQKVYCIEYCKLSDEYTESRTNLLKYFGDGHQDDVVCVYDNSTRIFMGIITYQSLNRFLIVREAIRTEYLVLDENIWKSAREYCRRHPGSGTEYLIPVLDRDNQLICFAYEDLDANREIRMLRELMELPDALQFTDVYSQYKSVRIYEFNELAYFFAKYLESQNIAVQVEGAMWQGFFSGREYSVPDYECLNVYAEGTWNKKYSWKENLLRSVSVEFECIDKIYETNIRDNIIKNVVGEYNVLLESLREEKEVVLCGTGMRTQDTYDFFLANGIDICCFMIDEVSTKYVHRLFGKKILGVKEVIHTYPAAVLVDSESKNSAWGFGQVDYYDYIGYKRNKNYFLLRDYIDVPSNGLEHVLSNWKVFLIGDSYLCKYLDAYLKSKSISVTGYLDISIQESRYAEKSIRAIDENQDILFLLVAPDFFVSNDHNIHTPNELKQRLKEYLKKININNYSDYFSYIIPYIKIEESNGNKYPNKKLVPKRIVVGDIESTNGCTFLEGLLDSHPNILLMFNYYGFKDNLFWTSIRLSTVKAKDILSAFWNISEEWDHGWCRNTTKFNEKMRELLAYSDRFTSQEIFVILFISYMCEWDREISESIIYWDPHYLISSVREECVKWLGAEEVHCDIVNLVRNVCMAMGSRVKGMVSLGWTGGGIERFKNAYVAEMYSFWNIDKKQYKWSDRLVVKFEELKCYPKETLMKMCAKWGITWHYSLMQTTKWGEKWTYNNGESLISDFNLTPVYDIYEKYFSEFDRLRIMIIQALWQRKYGYPYVELKQFSRRELQEMFLKGFRFESLIELEGEELDFRIKLQYIIRNQLQKIRMLETLENAFFEG